MPSARLRRRSTAKRPDWQPWVLFFLRALDRQKNHLSARVEREKLVIAQLPELSVRILDFARDHGRVSARHMLRLTGASRNTLKQQLSQLAWIRNTRPTCVFRPTSKPVAAVE